jgi:hypothetical protein
MSSSLNKLAIFAIDRSQNQNDVAKYNDLNLYSVDYGIDKKGGAGYRVITSKIIKIKSVARAHESI